MKATTFSHVEAPVSLTKKHSRSPAKKHKTHIHTLIIYNIRAWYILRYNIFNLELFGQKKGIQPNRQFPLPIFIEKNLTDSTRATAKVVMKCKVFNESKEKPSCVRTTYSTCKSCWYSPMIRSEKKSYHPFFVESIGFVKNKTWNSFMNLGCP